jgi:hypothetical protein
MVRDIKVFEQKKLIQLYIRVIFACYNFQQISLPIDSEGMHIEFRAGWKL